jgi:hypothetical protein
MGNVESETAAMYEYLKEELCHVEYNLTVLEDRSGFKISQPGYEQKLFTLSAVQGFLLAARKSFMEKVECQNRSSSR